MTNNPIPTNTPTSPMDELKEKLQDFYEYTYMQAVNDELEMGVVLDEAPSVDDMLAFIRDKILKTPYRVAGKEILFSHTAVNGDMHLFIDGDHDPEVCPECIQPGILVELHSPIKSNGDNNE